MLREQRLDRTLSMNALAERAGLSQQMISYVERGMRNPSLETLLRITRALKLDLAEVIYHAQETAKKRQ